MIDSGWYQVKTSAGVPVTGVWRREYADRAFSVIQQLGSTTGSFGFSPKGFSFPEYQWSLSYGIGDLTFYDRALTLEDAMRDVDDKHEFVVRSKVINSPARGTGTQSQLRIESYRRPK